MSDIARIGFVGGGSHANRRLYPALKMVQEARLVAVCDIDEATADRTASHWGAAETYYDIDRMLDQAALDAVVICGSPQMHLALGRKCIERKLPFYVEKPSAIDCKTATQFADEAEAAGVKAMCGFMKRYSPAYLAAMQIQQTAEFGEQSMAEIRFSQGPYPKLWGIEENMRAFLIGQLVHIFDLTHFLCGKVKTVHAQLMQHSDDYGVFAVNLQFASGALGIMSLNAMESTDWIFNEVVHLTGFQEYVRVEDQLYIKYRPKTGWLPEALRDSTLLNNQTMQFAPPLILQHNSLEVGGYVGEMRDLAVCSISDKQPDATLRHCAHALQLAEGIWKSSQSGQTVALNY